MHQQSASRLTRFETLFESGAVGSLDDECLLSRFASHGEEVAFAVLVERHGPMVLRVCQHVLGDHHDAQDAFQAVFLVLARRAGSIRRKGSVGSWLHGVALRVAAKAKVAASRRRVHECRGGEMAARRNDDRGSDAESWAEIQEEMGRLPEKFRSPLVLCYLEGLTQEMAARQLGWPLGTLQSRLARGRERLRSRLSQCGIATPAALLGSGAGTMPRAIVSAALVDSTVRAAVPFAAGEAIPSGLVPAAALALAEAGVKAMSIAGLVRGAIIASIVGLAAGTTGLAGWKGVATLNLLGQVAPTQHHASDAKSDGDALKGDFARLQGTWTMTQSEGGLSREGVTFIWELKGRTLTIARNGPGDEMSRGAVELKLHETDRPKRLELTNGRAPDGKPAQDIKAIYELDGDTLRICRNVEIRGPLPEEFKPGKGHMLMTFRRGGGIGDAQAAMKGAAAKKVGGSNTKTELKGDLARLQGTWASEASTPEGTTTIVEIRGSALTMTRTGPGGSLYRHAEEPFRIDEAVTPRAIDFLAPNVPQSRGNSPGIYEIDGETLKLAIDVPGGLRPTEFRSGGGDHPPHLLILKRKKEAR